MSDQSLFPRPSVTDFFVVNFYLCTHWMLEDEPTLSRLVSAHDRTEREERLLVIPLPKIQEEEERDEGRICAILEKLN